MATSKGPRKRASKKGTAKRKYTRKSSTEAIMASTEVLKPSTNSLVDSLINKLSAKDCKEILLTALKG